MQSSTCSKDTFYKEFALRRHSSLTTLMNLALPMACSTHTRIRETLLLKAFCSLENSKKRAKISLSVQVQIPLYQVSNANMDKADQGTVTTRIIFTLVMIHATKVYITNINCINFFAYSVKSFIYN